MVDRQRVQGSSLHTMEPGPSAAAAGWSLRVAHLREPARGGFVHSGRGARWTQSEWHLLQFPVRLGGAWLLWNHLFVERRRNVVPVRASASRPDLQPSIPRSVWLGRGNLVHVRRT